MIQLINVSKAYRRLGGKQVILKNATLDLDLTKNIGVLGRNGSGKSTLVRLLARAERPDSGQIIHKSRVSWPLGYGGVLLPNLTGRDNASLIAELYGKRPADVHERVQDFADLGVYFDMPVRTYSSGMRSRLSLGLSLAIEFDCYLIDEILSVGDHRFRERSRNAILSRRDQQSLILVSHNPNTIKDFCDCAMVLNNGELFQYDDVNSAVRAYQAL